jgi:hypothetical protein
MERLPAAQRCIQRCIQRFEFRLGFKVRNACGCHNTTRTQFDILLWLYSVVQVRLFTNCLM